MRHIISISVFFLFFSCCPPVLQPQDNCAYEEQTPEPSLFYATRGPASYKNQTLGWVQTKGGPLQLESVFVANGVSADRNITSECSDLGYISSGGELWLLNSILRGFATAEKGAWCEHSLIHGGLSICGNLYADTCCFFHPIGVTGNIDAKRSVFEGTIQASADFVQLDHVRTHDLIIWPDKDVYDIQIVKIKNHTTIVGDIRFLSCRGKVIIDHTSRILGQIYGGSIIEPGHAGRYELPN